MNDDELFQIQGFIQRLKAKSQEIKDDWVYNGNELANNIMTYYEMYCKCPGDFASITFCKCAFNDWLKEKEAQND
jgi:hypothetical protein